MGTEPASISYFAMSIMGMAVISKLISAPLTYKSAKASQKMQQMQPAMEELKKKYGYDERILQQKTMEFYKENNMSMAGCSSCLPMLIQLIIIIALFAVIREPQKYLFNTPGEFEQIHKNFFWISDLGNADPYWFALPLINALSQYLVQMLNPMTQQSNSMGNSMKTTMMLMPAIFFIMALNWASALLLYWAFGNILEIVARGVMRLFMRNKKVENA